MPEMWDRIEEFAKVVEKGYKEISLTNPKKHSITPTYDSITSAYVQLAYKFIMPKWIFEENSNNETIASDYADGLNRSEISYLIKKMEESQKSKNSPIINEINHEELLDYFLSVENATDLFLPLDIFYNGHFYHNFEIKNRSRLKLGNKEVQIHISNDFIPFDKIFVLNASGVTWSQKKVKDMTISQKKDPEGLRLLTDKEDILQISAKINEDGSVLFLMRLVTAVSINPEKVRMIEVSKNLLEKQVL